MATILPRERRVVMMPLLLLLVWPPTRNAVVTMAVLADDLKREDEHATTKNAMILAKLQELYVTIIVIINSQTMQFLKLLDEGTKSETLLIM